MAFNVSICNAFARNLTPLDGMYNDTYALFDFGGMYKYKTPVAEKTCNPDWEFSADFIYQCRFAHKLHHDLLTVYVFDKPVFNDDKLIGTCKIDLHTIATGPTHHQYTLTDSVGNKAGFILFDVYMNQLLRDMKCEISNVTIPTSESRGRDSSTSLQLQCFYSESSSKVVESTGTISSDAFPYFATLPTLELDTDAASLAEESAQIVLVVNVVLGDMMKEFGRAHLTCLEYHRMDEQPVHFAVPICDSSGQISNIFGEIYLTNGPQWMQMFGKPTEALSHDETVSFNGYIIRSYPLPTALVPEKTKKNAAEQKSNVPTTEEIQTSVSARPVKIRLSTGNFPAKPIFSDLHRFLSSVSPPRDARNSLDNRHETLIVEPVTRQVQEEDYVVAIPWSWSMRTDKHGKVFFRQSKNKATTWQDPRFLPADWIQMLTDKGKVYFAQLSTKLTTWTDPRGLPHHWSCTLHKGGEMVYLFKHKQGIVTTSATDPRGLQDGTTQHMDAEKSREYFQNAQTETTTWDDPRTGVPRAKLIATRVAERRRWEVKMLLKAARRNLAVCEVRGKRPHIPEDLQKLPLAVLEDYERQLTEIQESFRQNKKQLEEEKEKWFRDHQLVWSEMQVSIEQKWSIEAGRLRREKDKLISKQNLAMQQWEQEYLAKMEAERKVLLEAQLVQQSALDKEQSKMKVNMLANREEGLKQLENTKIKSITQRLITYRLESMNSVKELEKATERLALDFEMEPP